MITRRIAILWDIDDVLFEWFDKAHQACVIAGVVPEGVYPDTWYPYEAYGITANEWYDILGLATETGYLYKGEPKIGAIETMREFQELGYEQHLVTARGFMQHADLVREHTYDWVREWEIPHTSLHFSRDKGVEVEELGITHAIDDNHTNYQLMEAAGAVTYLMDAVHNRKLDVEPGTRIRRVLSHEEFSKAVRNGGQK